MHPSLTNATLAAVASQSSSQLADVQKLRRLIERQRDRIDELEGILGLKPDLAIWIPGVRPMGTRILRALHAARLPTTRIETLVTLLWGDLPECDQPVDSISLFKVHLCSLDAALRPHDIKIARTGWGDDRALALSMAMKARLHAVNDRFAAGGAP